MPNIQPIIMAAGREHADGTDCRLLEWTFEQKLRKGKQGHRLWRPPTNARQWSDGDPKILITAVPLGEWGKLLVAGCTLGGDCELASA